MNRLLLILLILAVASPFHPVSGNGNQPVPQEEEPQNIVETVTVENIEVPVRVFRDNTPVKGLGKENFQLFINGKPREINGFHQETKLLEGASGEGAPGNSGEAVRERLFVFIFNLNDYHQEMNSVLDFLFNRLLRRGDRIIVITNRYFLPEWRVTDPAQIRERLEEVLNREIEGVKFDMMHYQSELKALAASLLSRLGDEGEASAEDYPAGIFRDFFQNYQFVLEDISRQFLSLPLEQYIKISEYLNSQRLQKWVFSFYQVGRLPMLDKMGKVYEELKYVLDGGSTVGGSGGSSGGGLQMGRKVDHQAAARVVQSMYFDFLQKLNNSEKQLVEDIGKAFLHSGATFHTMLMNPSAPPFSDYYRSQPVGGDTEEVLKRLSELTGGTIVRSNRLEELENQVRGMEDVLYLLTYVPGADERRKRVKLDVRVSGGSYRVVYDDRRRMKVFESAVKEVLEGVRRLEIDMVRCEGGYLVLKLRNIQMMKYDFEWFGAVQVKARVVNRRGGAVSSFERIFKGIREEGVVRTKLPELGEGKYSVVVEVRDLFSLDGVYVGDAVSFSSGKRK